MLCADQEVDYAGFIMSRFRRGDDAAVAVAGMGLLPAAIAATHLVIIFELADMGIALELPGQHPLGLVVVVASATEHTVRWHPIITDPARTTWAEWGPPSHHPGGGLPSAVATLLALWRRGLIEPDVSAVATRLRYDGYFVGFADRS